ncbi:hypothetical protein, partial [Rubripirellula tenax]|uniref:hypothetical protein n=1 Tax=Rubripirellula tenax TaxID=2528015 RepID=UPI001C97D99A
AFEIAFSQQFQRANPLAGSIFGELFFEISRNSCGHAISGQTLAIERNALLAGKLLCFRFQVVRHSQRDCRH